VMVADITTWGWISLILGLVLIGTGAGLLAGMSVARWTAVGVIAIGAMLQLPWFPAAPLWTILIISLSVIVIYELTARWDG
jgi:hypothetical protein